MTANPTHHSTSATADWAQAIDDWNAALVAAGRTPKTIALWIRTVRRAAKACETTPGATTPAALMAAIAPRLSPAGMKTSRTAIRAFYLSRGWTAGTDPVMTIGKMTVQVSSQWAQAISDWRQWLEAVGRTPPTIRLRTYHVTRAAQIIPVGPWDVTLDHLIPVLHDRVRWSAETRKSSCGSLKSFYGWALDTERISVDPTRKLPTIHIPPGRPKPTPDGVFAAAIAGTSERERRMLLLAAYAGLRRAEIAAVHTRDIQDGCLRVTGKGGRTRVIPLHPEIERALTGIDDGYIFPGKDRGHLSAGHVGKILQRQLGSGWTAHTLRHRFATKAYAVNRDLFAVQQLLGHSKPETTMRYTQLPADALRAAVMGAG